jgi:UDP-3-O-[3-hydroxymyristoyl] glucosamine N-acyltransferase
MDQEKHPDLWEIAHRLKRTSALFDLKEKSITFMRHEKYANYLMQTEKDVWVIVPEHISKEILEKFPPNVHTYVIDEDVDYVFASIHNKIHENTVPKENIIGKNCNIHETALIGIDGKKYIECPDGSKVQLKEIGNVVIGDNVDIDAYSIVRRSVMSSTILRKGVKVCAKVNIGHNCIIGENTLISPGVLIGGSTTIGNNCYIWQGSMTRSHIEICDNVIIGMGSIVTENITEPGVYLGVPAKYIKPYDKKLR